VGFLQALSLAVSVSFKDECAIHFQDFLLCLSLFQQPTGFNPISSLASDPYGYFQQSAFHHYPGGFGVSDGKLTLINGGPSYLTNGLKIHYCYVLVSELKSIIILYPYPTLPTMVVFYLS
jgi:hypothetical protein